ncbi:MAG: hypothetical protein N2Z40_03950 [Caldimicrobium sp.]|nr:hypothetical protein [Caldimicrobium sp.]MCX7613362.1 hypothetical protein [Caldimicrobium sp.]MDW8182159.1 hypothetical protein [Caldimicrobium sp.]
MVSRPRTPKRKAQKQWRAEVVEFILEFRKKCPQIAKEELKPFVNRFCEKRGIRKVSKLRIGKIIRYLKDKGEFEWRQE